MKNLLSIAFGLFLVSFYFTSCAPGRFPNPETTLPTGQDSTELRRASVEPKRVNEGNYPAVPADLNRRHNDEPPIIVPDGPKRGRPRPANKEYRVREQKPDPDGDSQAPLFFRDFEQLDGSSALAHTTLPEPSVAENGATIMTTGNNWMSLSEDGGATFTTVNPTTIFPEDYGGFCCDQVVQYVPRQDMFVWLLQYWDAAGVNAIRIAVQTTEGVRSSNGTAWTYYDFTNTALASSGRLDYNDMSFGNNFLYWTSSIGGAGNRYVIRIPLQELRAMGTVNYQFTGSTAATWSHVTQNGQGGVYWAGHVNNSTLKVYSMMDADGFYSWRDVAINSWPNSTMSSTAANGTNWLTDAQNKTYVRAATIHNERIVFAWNASDGSGFPQTHVQVVEINPGAFTLHSQFQIWNPDFAFAYPYFETNSRGEIGMIVAFGGGTFNASSGVGVWGDFVVYYPRLSDISRNNYGHYHTARRSGSDGTQWVGVGYTHNAAGNVLPYYIRFSR